MLCTAAPLERFHCFGDHGERTVALGQTAFDGDAVISFEQFLLCEE
jgi:hypothetical protein